MDDLQVAHEAAEAGAEVIRRHFGRGIEAEWKGDVDPVTAVDREAEEAVLAVIRRRRPSDRILAEESGGADWREGRVWIVDPLDGTVNFVPEVRDLGRSPIRRPRSGRGRCVRRQP
jgi:myo-inositol-1(or 4)-monophosphatase